VSPAKKRGSDHLNLKQGAGQEDSALGFQVIDELEGKPFSYGVERWPSLFKPVGEKDFLASLQGFFETKQPKP